MTIPEDPLAQAAFIMSTGKMIRDRTLRLQSCHVEQKTSRVKFSELTMAQSIAIMAIKEHEPMSVNELASHLSVSAPSASAMVDRLVDRHLLTRETDPADRRKVIIRLSPEAMDDYNNIYNVISQDFLNLVDKVGPETARKWCEVLVEVKKVILTEPLAKPHSSEKKGAGK
ncbi:MAG: MarR family transcriptional regulator [Desulfobacteraceae bacterium]|jgi:DNA-binding MarR family transcriptional regulator|nr:MarR family transcriptional regulator [Desulfobacteraceae bacterium]